MDKGYYNTTRVSGSQLALFASKARSQDSVILDWFMRSPVIAAWPPSTVHEFADLPPGTPLTSVRRALNSLTRQGYLEKTDERVDGPYGRPEYCWRLRTVPKEGAGR